MLTVENLVAGYDAAHVLGGVSMYVGESEVVCLVGRNGAGKTSLLRSIVQDQIRVSEGTVHLDGKNLIGLPSHQVTRLGVALVPEDRRVFASLTVHQNLLVSYGSDGPARVRWTIADVYRLFPSLQELRNRPAGVLSGGEQQMLSIGRSLLTNPRLLLLDEPNEGLAPIIVDSVVTAIHILRDQGMSMLISEQSLHLVQECANRMYVLDRGVIVHEATAEEFMQNPEVAERFLMVV